MTSAQDPIASTSTAAAEPASTSTPPAPAPITPSLAALLRLQTLTYLVHGSSSSSSSSSTDPILLRLSSAISSLDTVKKEAGKPLTRLVDDWDRYADLLHPLSSSENPGASHVRADGGGTWDAAEQATYLLSQSEELQESLQALQKIEALVDQRKVLDADKSRALSRAVSHTNANRLNKLKEQDAEEGKKADAIQDRVLDLVHGWSHYTSTLSQAFTLLDSELLSLERQVSHLERHSALTT